MACQPTENASLEPTVIYDPSKPESTSSDSASERSATARVGLVHGTKHSLSRETAELLRARLRATTLVVSIGLALFLVRLIFVEQPTLVWLRVVVLVTAAACYLFLRSQRELEIDTLRWVELVVLALVGVQTVSLQVVAMLSAAALGDATSANSAMMFAFVTWIVLIMAYGIFIPNSWQRSARLLIPAALIPLAVTTTLCLLDKRVFENIDIEWVTASGLLTCIAAVASVFGTYTVNSLRREAYQARKFGQYRLKKRLGYGGMGEVYLAEHQLLKRPSAIKLIRPGYDSEAEAVARFELEVRAIAQLSHFNTVEIFDYGRTEDGTFYYVMEYLPGLSLAEIVRQYGPLPPARAVHFLRQTCGALSEAHEVGLVHRDVKPANIFAAQRGGKWDVAKLLDFGLVQERGADAREEGERDNIRTAVAGSPNFMSPEQVAASRAPDARSDIYSLGTTAYYLLTGRPPFVEKTARQVMRAHLTERAVPPSKVHESVPPDLEEVVLRCLEKEPAERFQDVGQLEQALAHCECADVWTDGEAAKWWSESAEVARDEVVDLQLASRVD